MRINVTVKGDQETLDRLHKLGSDLHNFTDAMKVIGKSLATYYASTGFTDQGLPFGDEWAPLSPRYLKWKEKHYAGAGMLIRTGTMQESFEFSSDQNSVTIDNKAKYFKYHQSTAARKKIPRRATMGINEGIRSTIGLIIEQDVRRKIDGVKL